jgi:hypothetical protein
MEIMVRTRTEKKILATAWSVTALVGTVVLGVMTAAGMDARSVAGPATAAIITGGGSGTDTASRTCAP